MQLIHGRFALIATITALFLVACNIPAGTVTPIASEVVFSQTLSAMQTRAVQTATAQGIMVTSTATPFPSNYTRPTPASPNPSAIKDTLCWVGPGPGYEVISAIKKGTVLELLGRSTLPGWFIIRNPTYLDPCWMQASDLQIDPNLDLSGLPLFNPPSTVTPTAAPTQAVTPTSTGAIAAATTPAPAATAASSTP